MVSSPDCTGALCGDSHSAGILSSRGACCHRPSVSDEAAAGALSSGDGVLLAGNSRVVSGVTPVQARLRDRPCVVWALVGSSGWPGLGASPGEQGSESASCQSEAADGALRRARLAV